jgi:hypothetical protein
MQNPLGCWGVTWICGALARAMLAPTIATEPTKTRASAILLSMGSPCGFVVTVTKPTHRAVRRPDAGGATSAPWGKDLISAV